MRRSLLDILACPEDKTPLTLAVTLEDGDDVVEGLLTCTHCGAQYPIEESVPNLLPSEYRE